MEDILQNCQLFKGIDKEAIPTLLNKVGYRIVSFRKDEYLKVRGDELASFMIVLSGSVRGEMFGDTDKVLKIEDILPSMPIAGAFVFGNNNSYPVDVIANEEGSVVMISKESFIKILQLNKTILQNYLDFISNKTQFLSRKIFFLSFKTIKSKFANYLLDLKCDSNGVVHLKQSQQELAKFFGVTRSSLARAIGEMQQTGVIEVDRKRVIIIDKNKLLAV